jgi:hypothetical protein
LIGHPVELGVRGPDAGVDDVDAHPAAGGRVAVGAAERAAHLVGAVEPPGGARLDDARLGERLGELDLLVLGDVEDVGVLLELLHLAAGELGREAVEGAREGALGGDRVAARGLLDRGALAQHDDVLVGDLPAALRAALRAALGGRGVATAAAERRRVGGGRSERGARVVGARGEAVSRAAAARGRA